MAGRKFSDFSFGFIERALLFSLERDLSSLSLSRERSLALTRERDLLDLSLVSRSLAREISLERDLSLVSLERDLSSLALSTQRDDLSFLPPSTERGDCFLN
jgi:hypothetical protein